MILTIGAGDSAAVAVRRVCRLLKFPVESGPGGSGSFRTTSLETTVARTVISAVGAWQPPTPLTTQEQAAAGRANEENAATIKPIRDHIAALNLSRADFAIELVSARGAWMSSRVELLLGGKSTFPFWPAPQWPTVH